MTKVETSAIRNIALVGHEGNGKTTLLEAFLHHVGIITKMGRVKEKNMVSDFDPDEKDLQKSLFTSTVSFSYQGKQFNILDVPGSSDSIGELLTALRAVECAIVFVDPTSNIKVNTRRVWKEAEQINLPRIICVSRMDTENTDFQETLNRIRQNFGDRCIPLFVPDVSGTSFSRVFRTIRVDDKAPEEAGKFNTEIIEAIVEADESLMERYLEGEEISEEELYKTFKKALVEGSVFPVVVSASEKEIGTKEILDTLVRIAPSPDAILRKAVKGEEEVPIDTENGFVGFVYKTTADDFVTRISHIRILSGKISSNSSFVNRRTGKTERIGSVFKIMGKEHKDISEGVTGDIIGLAKVEEMRAGDTITDDKTDIKLSEIKFPVPMVSIAVKPKSRSDEQKIGTALKELEGDDRTFVSHHNAQTGDLVISGMSDLHLNMMLKRLKRKRKVEVETSMPKIPYMETVSKSVKNVEYTHKKQSGGAGQYARVFVDMKPLPRGTGYEFVDKIVGGVIDQTFRPSVNKGIQTKMAEGIITGYPVTDLRVTLVDGKTHPVDSKDIAFQIAGREVLKKAFLQCSPLLIEPIVKMEVAVPQESLGDIMGDLNSRRGRIMTSGSEGAMSVVVAKVPLAEVQTYQADFKSITGGEGSYTIEFDHYDIVPPNIQKEIMDKHEKEKAEAEK